MDRLSALGVALADREAAGRLLRSISERSERLGPVSLMEVCGTHTMAIAEAGLRSVLPSSLRLLSGPGCPVCVTPPGYVEAAFDLAMRGDVLVASFGDMLSVPSPRGSLLEARSEGAKVEVVYSALGALELARRHPELIVVFLAVGFETTAPTVAAALERAENEGLSNLKFLVSHKLVPPALDVLLSADDVGIDGFLLPGHVSVVIGADAYREVLAKHGRCGVVAGFAPLDLLAGIDRLLQLREEKAAGVENQYRRVVRDAGNATAQALLARVFAVEDAVWRGIGTLPASGLGLAGAFAHRDARSMTPVELEDDTMPQGCQCGDVLQGRIRPPECALFGTACTPRDPVGPCMVSSEGSCAAAFKYGEER